MSMFRDLLIREGGALLESLLQTTSMATALQQKLTRARELEYDHRQNYREGTLIGNSPRWSQIFRTGGPYPAVVKTGPNVKPSEAANMALIRSYTNIPVPKVLDSWHDPETGWWCIKMTDLYFGEHLDEIYHLLSARDKECLVLQLRGMLVEMRMLERCDLVAGADGTPSCDQMLQRHQDVYTTEREFREHTADAFLDRTLDANEYHTGVSEKRAVMAMASIPTPPVSVSEAEEDPDMEIKAIGKALYDLKPEARNASLGHSSWGDQFVFSHGNLTPRNILVEMDREGRGCGPRVVGILDWSQAGYYPAYWEYVKMSCCEQVETMATAMFAGALEAAEPEFLRDMMPDRLLADKFPVEAKTFRRAYREVFGYGDGE